MTASEDSLGAVIKRIARRRAIPRQSALQLPLWSERVRGLPNAMARSALFTCSNPRTPRKSYLRHQIASLAGYEIYYTGSELRQEDEDVFLQIIHLARQHQLGEIVEVSGNQLLKALHWPNSKAYYDRLRDTIERLQEGSVRINHESNSAGFKGSLIRKFSWKDGTEKKSGSQTKWKIYLEKEIVGLFGDDEYSLLTWEDRLKLNRLAKWLHSFYYTHKQPYPYSTAKLQELCGSKVAELRCFRRDVKDALTELVGIGFLQEFRHVPETDTFEVVRSARKALTAANASL